MPAKRRHEGGEGALMGQFDDIPEDCRAGFARLVSELVKFFSKEKRSGEAVVRFKEGSPMEVEPRPKVHLGRKGN